MSNHKLVPFFQDIANSFEVEAEITREGLKLDASYRLSGDLNSLLLPKTNKIKAERKGELWETTCFEFFLKNIRHPFYLEFNLAPTGHWNCFSFDGYRQNMREYDGIQSVDINFEKGENHILLESEIQLIPAEFFLPDDFNDGDIRCALSSVIENKEHVKTYWAPGHFSERPDFHKEENFSIQI